MTRGAYLYELPFCNWLCPSLFEFLAGPKTRHFSSLFTSNRRRSDSQLKEIDQSGNCISTNITNPSPFPPPLPSHVSTKKIFLSCKVLTIYLISFGRSSAKTLKVCKKKKRFFL